MGNVNKYIIDGSLGDLSNNLGLLVVEPAICKIFRVKSGSFNTKYSRGKIEIDL